MATQSASERALGDSDTNAKNDHHQDGSDDNDDTGNHDDSGDEGNKSANKSRNNLSGLNNSNSSTYRQRYKPAWELDPELREWLTACPTDAYSGYCKFCRTKLHAHKKGMLVHAKSSKHKKNVADCFAMGTVPDVNFSMPIDIGDENEGQVKRDHRGHRLFQDSWLDDPQFSAWLRKIPNNETRALCIACRSVIIAGKSELQKHAKAAKHKKAIDSGDIQELSEQDLQWYSFSSNSLSQNLPAQNTTALSLQCSKTMIDLPGMLNEEILDRLDKHVPLELAASWDNVGIITKPTQPIKVFNILLTIDLNEKIVEEAIKKRVQFIISYHPPIFHPIKRLNPSSWKEKALLMCIEQKITVYSPHTALDAIKGGINDWLISSFMTSEQDKVRPLIYSTSKAKTSCLEVLLSEPQENVALVFKDVNDVTMTDYGNSSTDVKVACDERSLPEHLEVIAKNKFAQLSSRVTKLNEMPIPGVGMGRLIKFETPLPLYEIVQRTKTHLDSTYIRLGLSPKHTRDTKVNSIAVCAGSGGSVLKDCDADVWITGEMSHHEVLDANNKGSTVILCEHSNTERGFLRDWSQQLRSIVFEDQVMVSVSELDRDPLRIV